MKVLLVDDEEELVTALAERLSLRDIEADWVTCGMDAITRVSEDTYDVIVLDVKMPGMGGVNVLKEMKKRAIKTEVAIITGYLDSSVAEEAMKFGPLTVIPKPFNDSDIQTVLSRALNR